MPKSSKRVKAQRDSFGRFEKQGQPKSSAKKKAAKAGAKKKAQGKSSAKKVQPKRSTAKKDKNETPQEKSVVEELFLDPTQPDKYKNILIRLKCFHFHFNFFILFQFLLCE